MAWDSLLAAYALGKGSACREQSGEPGVIAREPQQGGGDSIKSSRPALLPKEFQASLGNLVSKAITIGI